jgi:hypothetical protein
MDGYYKEIMVWKYVNDTHCVRYCCFQTLKTHQYCVQSCDFFYLPIVESRMREFDMQFVELFIAVEQSERSPLFDSLEEAILAFEEDFS